MALSPLLNFLVKASRKSTRLLSRDYFELENLQNSKRPTTDFVARSRIKVDESLREELLLYPDSAVIYNVQSPDPTKAMHFVVTPINGASNLSRAIPFFASIIVACEYKGGEMLPLASVINFPALGEIVYAEHGRGSSSERSIDNSSQHGLKLRVSAHSSLESAMVATDIGLFKNSRSFGCDMYSAYLVAAGKIDIFLSNEMDDATKLAAGQLVHEAGGRTHADKEVLGIKAKFAASNGNFGL
jgi:myo-inositol-1(or 4)-monophosphatase